MYVHRDSVADYPDYVVVSTRTDGPGVGMADPAHTCLHRLRPYTDGPTQHLGYCLLDKGHRGRHAGVVFYCDSCGKARRGQWYRRATDANGDTAAVFCFMCCEVMPR